MIRNLLALQLINGMAANGGYYLWTERSEIEIVYKFEIFRKHDDDGNTSIISQTLLCTGNIQNWESGPERKRERIECAQLRFWTQISLTCRCSETILNDFALSVEFHFS